MKITNVEAIHLRLPKVTGEADSTEDALVIRIETDEGITGIGEVDSSSNVVKSVIEGPVYQTEFCRGLGGLLIGEDPFDIECLWEKMCKGTLYYGRRGAAVHAVSFKRGVLSPAGNFKNELDPINIMVNNAQISLSGKLIFKKGGDWRHSYK